MKKLFGSTAFVLIVAILAGTLAGYGIKLLDGDAVIVARETLMSLKKATGQVIFFMVPLLIFACVTPSITRLSSNVTSLLVFTMVLAFPTMDTMSALLLALLVGLGVVWTKYSAAAVMLEKLQEMILLLVRKILLPLLPVFVGSNFALLAYTGQITNMGVFLPVVAMIVVCQLVWIVFMYVVASVYTGRNGWHVLKYYPKAYFTALGSMSSAATLPFAIECIEKSPIVKKETYDFTLPLFCNIHLCGSVIAEIALVTTTYYTLNGSLPSMLNLAVFSVVACVIAIGSPGVPGGLNVACSTIVGSIILGGENPETFIGIMTAIYTVQDGFGTACNVTTDGALTLICDKKVAKIESGDIVQ